MSLQALIEQVSRSPVQSVPDWMLGCFRRRCISFANGESDTQTLVYWLQSRSLTIDLRLPVESDQVRAADWLDYSPEELSVLANYEGWIADCRWDGSHLAWQGGTALQTTDRWPEPADLRRVGNCMIEFAPSGAYVEDWRLQPSGAGPLIGLRLLEENGAPRAGGLIVCGDYAGLVLDRTNGELVRNEPVPEQAVQAAGDAARLEALLSFETSIAWGSLSRGYTVRHSTRPGRVGQSLIGDSQFEWLESTQRVRQTLTQDGQTCVREYAVDVIEHDHDFSLFTPSTADAKDWFTREQGTLGRYTGVLS